MPLLTRGNPLMGICDCPVKKKQKKNFSQVEAQEVSVAGTRQGCYLSLSAMGMAAFLTPSSPHNQKADP